MEMKMLDDALVGLSRGFAKCKERPPRPFIKLAVLAQGRRLPKFVRFLMTLVRAEGRDAALSRPDGAFSEHPGKTLALHYRILVDGAKPHAAEIQALAKDETDRDWGSRLHLARALQVLAGSDANERRQLTNHAIAVGSSAMHIISTFSASEFSHGFVDAMNMTQQLNVGSREIWQHASREIWGRAHVVQLARSCKHGGGHRAQRAHRARNAARA
jgi:hypothetical protein